MPFAELRAELATVLSGGMNLCMSITIGYDGTLEEPAMQLIDNAGAWLRARRAHIAGAETIHDVAVVLGTNDPKLLDWPGGGDYSPTLLKMEEHLRQSGYLPRRLLNSANSQRWDSIPAGIRALIVPSRACLTEADAAKIDRFVRSGGRVIAFGRGIGLGHPADAPKAHPLFGVTVAGYRPPPIWRGMQMQWASERLPLLDPMLDLRMQGAEALAWATTASEGALPAITRARAGQGTAVAVAPAETALVDHANVLAALWKESLPAPIIRVRNTEGRDVTERYTVRLRRDPAGYVLHVIDSAIAQEVRKGLYYKAAYVDVSIDASLYPFREATLVPEGRRLPPSSSPGWNTIRVIPSPEVIVLLR
jgi:hypothetical protein